VAPRIAYLADGKMFLLAEGAAPRPLESRFAEEVRDRAARLERRSAWKTQGSGFAAAMRGGGQRAAEEAGSKGTRVATTGLSRGRTPGELIYALETEAVTGLFAVDGAGETRLFHGNEQHIAFPQALPGGDQIACTVRNTDGSSHVAVMAADGSRLTVVTEGDSQDLAPSWAAPRRLLYQSAGIGRDRAGRFAGLGPSAIQRLDLDGGKVSTLAEHTDDDCLGPRAGPDGALYYIRRPWRATARPSPFRLLLDILLFPVRLLWALFQWLNFFGVKYTGKPLVSREGAQARQADLQQWMIWGNVIDAAREQKKALTDGETVPSLVPHSWRLVRAREGAPEEVLARGVAAFDVGTSGVVYSNGAAVYHLAPDGKRTLLAAAPRIEQVVIVEEDQPSSTT
jgi:hypothetical protein